MTCSAAAPQGTSGAQIASASSSRAKSASPVIPAGLPAGTAICRTFSVKTSGSAACRSSSVTTDICAWLAEAKTSAGAPWTIWVASAELPAKLNWISRPGLSAVSWSPSSPKTSVSEAAAKTVSVPDSSPSEDDVVPEAVSSADEPPQALTAISTADSASRARVLMTLPVVDPQLRRTRPELAACAQEESEYVTAPTGRRRSPASPSPWRRRARRARGRVRRRPRATSGRRAGRARPGSRPGP